MIWVERLADTVSTGWRQRRGVAGCQNVGNSSDNSHIGGDGSEKGLEAIVGGAVREVTSEYLQSLVSSTLMMKTGAAG